MNTHDITLIGAPLDCGKQRAGCLMGPDAYRTAGLPEALRELGHSVQDAGNVAPNATRPRRLTRYTPFPKTSRGQKHWPTLHNPQ